MLIAFLDIFEYLKDSELLYLDVTKQQPSNNKN